MGYNNFYTVTAIVGLSCRIVMDNLFIPSSHARSFKLGEILNANSSWFEWILTLLSDLKCITYTQSSFFRDEPEIDDKLMKIDIINASSKDLYLVQFS